ncbi:hypothetical protein WJX81_002393 [Elliptochloris bilobata]|uniref:Uncharacterized protein n=1 Tax=Elliptochloris bilobata TaxID=381761 RepID=A0AAW1RYT0_9CHLO
MLKACTGLQISIQRTRVSASASDVSQVDLKESDRTNDEDWFRYHLGPLAEASADLCALKYVYLEQLLVDAEDADLQFEELLRNALGEATLLTGVAAATSLVVTAFDLDFMRPLAFFSLAPSDASCFRSHAAGVAMLADTASPDEQDLPRFPMRSESQEAAERFSRSNSREDSGHSAGIRGASPTPRDVRRIGHMNYLFDWRYDVSADFALKDVVRASSAAPTYLPIAHVLGNPGATTQFNMKGGRFAA